ncbi:MAG: efflux RND transporter periplasmic adaptor subunit [Acidobacteria bacterium]|nr:efflux RND transporter periplasmic adaptor subunit [Acidobacteriota bacterium]
MDIQRGQSVLRAKRRKRIIFGLVGLLVLVGVTVGLMRLRPAPPGVEYATLWPDTVKRGPMLRQVRGLGTLVPEEIRWIPTLTEGRVEKILVRPGTKVKAGTVLLVLSNPQLTQEAMDADLKLKAAGADYRKLEVSLTSDVLNQKAVMAKAERDAEQAAEQERINKDLLKLGVISPQTEHDSATAAEQLKGQADIEKQRYENSMQVRQAQLAAQQSLIDQAKELAQLKHTQLEALKIKAGTDGVLQEMAINDQELQEGQQVTAGTTIAKVANPARLKAQLKIPETQAKDVQIAQVAEVDTHNGIIPGRVSRIDPAVINGTRTVDVTLEGALPAGAVPDLSVDGTVTLQRLSDVLYVGRPAFGQDNSTVGMFKLDPDGKDATRVQVKLGATSVNAVEILGGLKEGDQVILSDMSRYDAYDRIRLER